MSERRLQNEFRFIQDNPMDFCTVELVGDDLFTWNGKFDDGAKFQIKFHEQHPYSPPKKNLPFILFFFFTVETLLTWQTVVSMMESIFTVSFPTL